MSAVGSVSVVAIDNTNIAADYVLVYRGFVYSSTGYGQEARAFIRGLLALGMHLEVVLQFSQ